MKTRRRWARLVTGVVLVSAALAAAGVLSAYRADLREALDRVEGRSAVVRTACGPIEYAEAGEGPAVLVVHGAGGGFDQGLLLAEELAPRGFRVVSMSRFGFLRTPLPEDASIEAQADAHACLMDALGIGQAAFIGASAGATSSAQMAIRHPDRVTALVLLVPALYAPRPDGEPSIHVPRDTQWLLDRALSSDFIAWAAIRSMPGRVTESLQATPLVVVQRAGAAEQARVARMRTLVLPVSRRREGMLNDASLLPDIPPYPLERIRAPTLAISARDDLFGTLDSARHSVERIPGARLLELPDGGHLWVGHHERVVRTMAEFLAADTRGDGQ